VISDVYCIVDDAVTGDLTIFEKRNKYAKSEICGLQTRLSQESFQSFTDPSLKTGNMSTFRRPDEEKLI
jgi:hypothetical protein